MYNTQVISICLIGIFFVSVFPLKAQVFRASIQPSHPVERNFRQEVSGAEFGSPTTPNENRVVQDQNYLEGIGSSSLYQRNFGTR